MIPTKPPRIGIALAAVVLVVLAAPAFAKKPSVPPDAIAALARVELASAIGALRSTSTAKAQALRSDCRRIIQFSAREEKPHRSEARRFYLNAAIASHNLFLFLQAEGIDAPAFAEQAEELYRKARRKGSKHLRPKCELLRAALLAARGERDEAAKRYAKVDTGALLGDFAGTAALVGYHAAMEEPAEAAAALETACRLEPISAQRWIAVGDDFHPVATDAGFAAALARCRKQDGTTNDPFAHLTLPPQSAPRLVMYDRPPEPCSLAPKRKRRK